MTDAINRKRDERIAALREFGIDAGNGKWLGCLNLTPTEAEKLLKLLRRLTKLTGKTPAVIAMVGDAPRSRKK